MFIKSQAWRLDREFSEASRPDRKFLSSTLKRAVDFRAGQLQAEYVAKARAADRRQGVLEGAMGRGEAKLLELGQ